MIIRLSFFILLCSNALFGQSYTWNTLDLKTNTNIRGVSVVNDSIAWFSGSNGWVGLSINGGKSWQLQQVKGFEKKDFRSIYAFNSTRAIIANAGSPASILITHDAGKNWNIVYANPDTTAFIDGMDFWNEKEGIVYGDPIGHKLLVLITHDGGLSWIEFPDSSRPALSEGEASFAASGTGIRCIDDKRIIIATGGKISRLLISNDKGIHWDSLKTPILQGKSTSGIFSVACKNKKSMVIVGGDFLMDTLKTDHVFYTTDVGIHWISPSLPTGGYRECVEYINQKTFVATGPFGSEISYDGGKIWNTLSVEKSFHVIRKSRSGSLIIAAGKGKIALIRKMK